MLARDLGVGVVAVVVVVVVVVVVIVFVVLFVVVMMVLERLVPFPYLLVLKVEFDGVLLDAGLPMFVAWCYPHDVAVP